MAIEYRLTASDLGHVRLLHDAVQETAASLYAVVHPRHHVIHSRLRQHVPKEPDFDLGLLVHLTRTYTWVPDVLHPAPDPTRTTPREQLDRVRGTPLATAERDLERFACLGLPLPPEHADPRSYVEHTADALLGYWTAVLEPLWERVQSVIDLDLAHRQSFLASHGLADLLHDVFDGLVLEESVLTVDLDRHDCVVDSPGLGLWLVPSVFRWPHPAFGVAPGEPLTISYPARGAGQQWEAGEPEVEAMPSLIGRNRSRILVELTFPRTTTRLAAALGLSPATVSEHLTVLRLSGLVTAHRDGRRVLYTRSRLGQMLLDGEAATTVWATT